MNKCDSCEWKKNVKSTANNAHLTIIYLQIKNERLRKAIQGWIEIDEAIGGHGAIGRVIAMKSALKGER